MEISQNFCHFGKIPGISPNLMEFTKFHQFWGFAIFQKYRFHPIHAFKAEKVTLREVSRTAATKSLFHTKTAFSVNFCFWAEFPVFWWKVHFSGPGPPKNLPERCVYKGFYAGAAKVPFWTKKSTFWPRNAKNRGIPGFLAKWACHLKMGSATWKSIKKALVA